jgi:putative transposase
MKLPRKTSYYTPKYKHFDEALIDRIGDICLEFARCGYRRLTKQLHRKGLIVNHKKAARIMREKNWSWCPRKMKLVTTTCCNQSLPIYPNLIEGLALSALSQLWVADITYIRIPHLLRTWP